ncbi:MAG TPA: ATP-dependent helicase HrpB [Gemmatimonadales bacterium]|jgi:ATP-dependent helicase HrpB|nr:ATP-dependent helicase HrpB [Gemmatimonadales bacterium]
MDPLPVESVLPALRTALQMRANVVLQAPPGSGKTTRVPLALLDEPWLEGRRIVLLEPRRLAARAAARYMARTLAQPIGETVGYRIRRDTQVGARTRLEVVTEGVLTRMLQADPSLPGIGLLIFDEFHERSLHADLGLALALHSQALVRPDLRMLVMSATLDGAAVSELLHDAPLLSAEGRVFPVEVRYRPPRDGVHLDVTVAAAAQTALEEEDGDVLVFLPGVAEIRRVASKLEGAGGGPAVSVVPLYGDLSPDAQDAAIQPSPAGRRKLVLATSIAETSLTIDGVRVVIDAGLSRVPRFSVRRGMATLATVRVSLASAEQRRGRAGRVAPGICYRLWPERLDPTLRPHDTPEILAADLAPLTLELAEAGIADPMALRWLDPPPAASLAQARELLAELGALDAAGHITPHGRRMNAVGTHPRLAHMLLRGVELGFGRISAELAAVLSDRDPLRAEPTAGNDVRTRLEAIRSGDARIPPAVLHRLRTEAKLLRGSAGGTAPPVPGDVDAAGRLLALAYPDRIAQRRHGPAQRFLLRHGQGARFDQPQAIGEAEYIVAAELDGDARESRIFLAAPLTLDEVMEQFADQITTDDVVEWDAASDLVVARRQDRLGALVLRAIPAEATPERIQEVVLGGIARAGVDALPWSDAAKRLRERLRFLHQLDSGWPDVSDAALNQRLSEWLGPSLRGVRRGADLRRVDLAGALLLLLDWQRRRELDSLAPTHVEVPSGSRIAIDYADPSAPVLPVRLQEVFGWQDTPRIGGGRVPLTLHLLSPAGRPVQVTRDLAGFWRGTYFEVRKDLKGRYPKHSWPDDPLTAVPTSRARRPR